jgi:hypothetical protein
MRTVGSVNHPGLYDPAMMVTIKAAFHEVWKTITVHTPPRDPSRDEDLKAAIIRQLLDLVAEGTTSQDELRTQVLRKLPWAKGYRERADKGAPKSAFEKTFRKQSR